METRIVPELREKIEAAAAELVKSPEDFIEIAGADNKTLVKANSELGRKMLSEKRVLFPFSQDGNEFLVCIANPR